MLDKKSEEYRRVALAMDAELQNVFNENVKFFKRIQHPYFSKFLNYVPKRLRLRLSVKGYVNLYNVNTGKDVYPEDPCVYAEKQAAVFLKKRPHFILTQTLVDLGHADYPDTEYINNTNDKYEQLVSQFIMADEHLVEQLFMYGAGLCLQLQYVLNALDVKNLVVFEPDDDAIYNSLYVINWEAILSYFNRPGYNFHIFNVTDTDDNFQVINSIFMKKGYHRCSKLDNYFHYENDELRSLSNNIKFYLMNTLGGLGYFEDERVGLAHTLANVEQQIPYSMLSLSEQQEYCEKPVLIVGNGPSLDQLDEFLHERKDQFIIISCGTSLSTLLKKGIQPDIHIEQERWKLISGVIADTSIEKIRNELFFVGLNPCHPEVFSLFKNKYMVCKSHDLGVDLFKQHGDMDLYELAACNPLVSNFGLALAIMLGFKNIYLAGVDCGMVDVDQHHSKDSFYYTHEFDIGEHYSSQQAHEVKGNFRETAHTNPVFNKSRMELEAVLSKYQPECFNLSDGVYIKGSEPTPSENVPIFSAIDNKPQLIKSLLGQCFSREKIDIAGLNNELTKVKQYFSVCCDNIQQQMDVSNCSYEQMAVKFDEIERIIQKSDNECRSVYRILNGSIRGMMVNLSSAKKVMSDKKFEEFRAYVEAEQAKYFASIRRQMNETLLQYL